jgi:hypothetical protein
LGVLGAVLTAAIIGKGAELAYAHTPRDSVVFENSKDFPVALVVDGQPREVIAAHAVVRVELGAGEHEVLARGESGYAEKGTLAVTRSGTVFLGLYVIGAHSRMAIASRAYGAKGADRLDRVADGLRFLALPPGTERDAIDQPFPEMVMSEKGTPNTTVTHLCHVEPQWRSVGCWRP